MSDQDQELPAPEFPVAPSEFSVPIDEFCTQLSTKDRRVELIGGFAFTEKLAGRHHSLPSEYQARFEAFCNLPA